MFAKEITERVEKGFRRIDLAYVELASSEIARDINRDIVLEIVRSKQPISRADLSRVSGLQPSTVSNIVEQLLQETWIVEGAVARRPRGRRPTMLSLNDNLVMLVADLRPRRAILAIIDLNGRMLAHEEISIFSDPERSVAGMIEAMQAMRDRFPHKTFEGVGISVPGRVHPKTNHLIHAPNLKWADYDIKGAIQKKLHLQVELDNDATACLLSELWFGRMDKTRNAVLISLSEGLGTAIFANGQIVSGLNGLAGEFGHIPVDPAGPLCGCGKRGCWETLASSDAALRFYSELRPNTNITSIQNLMHLAKEGDSHAIKAIKKQALHLGQGLRLVTAALSPELLLITGALTTAWSTFGSIVQEELISGILAGSPPRLEITTGGEMARLRGAAAIALQRHSGYHSSLRRSINTSKRSESATKTLAT
ncbi:ROK family protein [Tunturiibacter empetritectus]|uniref:NBD/HSP70 family sugar kinase n=2 Tax=Tunturiibacter TaxID=3154218 RepID=A0A852VF13_9BACT|nr:ROK family protein [Edaphobacter lichenicola]NYF90240.1 putative NBD/HSP70 family sugar kinase [Edaphobacter lichenicola]